MTHRSSVTLTCVLALALVACDGTSPDAPLGPSPLEPGAFSATVSSPSASVTLGGTAASTLSTDDTAFEGTFGAYVIAETGEVSDEAFTFTVLNLRADSGEEILLGSIAPGERLASGTYGIESSRNLDAPFDFLALYTGEGMTDRGDRSTVRAASGSVDVTVTDGQISGTFSLAFPDGLTASGSFNAAPAEG
ncbi:MAG: hypothetical protein AAF791_10700 [Bacteroidota bacterium]